MRFLRALATIAFVLIPGFAAAQMASLVADQVQVVGRENLVASGNVVVIFGQTRLSATSISYNQSTGLLDIGGPITLTDGNGTFIIADAAQLSSDLQNGILQSARMVLDQKLQIAAVEINRVSGRYTQATQVVASSCQVCINRPVPLWAIRASRVIHDQQERQLYFYDAQLRVMDIPVFYLPRLRLPDPTVQRATGFLAPRIRANTQVGTGLYMPYFITIGDHADLLLAPFVSQRTTTLEARFRQEFSYGNLAFNGAVSRDTLQPGIMRYYLFGDGTFNLPRDFTLDFHLEQVSDTAYLSDYSYSSRDRLRNLVSLTRTRRDQYINGELGNWETLRTNELLIADQLPFAQADFLYEQRFQPGTLGGEIALQFSAQGHARASTLDILGRDQARIGAGLNWQRNWTLNNGMIASAEAMFAADFFHIRQDTNFAPEILRVSHAAALGLAWPLMRHNGNGVSDVLEPVVQLAWVGQNGATPANEDSRMVEFDMANLFDLSRFPGADATESGLRANLGATWTRTNPDGLSFTLAAGKVFRQAALGQFSEASGLNGAHSDWLVGGQVQLGSNLFAQSRALIGDDFSITKAETLATWHNDRLALSAGQVWVIADATEGRTDPTHEWTLDTTYEFDDFWTAGFSAHYDAAAGDATKADLAIEYRNECVILDLSLSRRFTSSGSITPTTDVGFGVTLTGFGNGDGGRSHKCSG